MNTNRLIRLAALFLLCNCTWLEDTLNWYEYKEAALKEGYIPLRPEELSPDTPAKAYLSNSHRIPYLAGKPMPAEQRALLQKAMQEATQIRVNQQRAATNNPWSLETKEKEYPVVAMNEEFRQLVIRWASAPEWLETKVVNVNFGGYFHTYDEFYFLDAQGNVLACLGIPEFPTICKPDGQEHYDDMRDQLYKALGIPY